MQKELKPCPFCGGEVKTFEEHTDNGAPEHWYQEYDSYFVECEKCKVSMVNNISMELVIEAWNRRV